MHAWRIRTYPEAQGKEKMSTWPINIIHKLRRRYVRAWVGGYYLLLGINNGVGWALPSRKGKPQLHKPPDECFLPLRARAPIYPVDIKCILLKYIIIMHNTWIFFLTSFQNYRVRVRVNEACIHRLKFHFWRYICIIYYYNIYLNPN